jgi:outer membrane receptor protein involved in Fe transport
MATESSVYVENLISPFDWFNTNIGLRYNFYYSGKQLFTDFEPRITVNLMSDNLGSLKASYSKMMQPVHLLSLSGIGLPTDLWVPSVDNVKPVISQQYVIGYNKQILPGIELSLEAYKKDMANVISYKEGAYFYGGTQSWKDKIEIDGVGRSMGVEMLLRKTKGKATGWISYTLAKSERKFVNLNNGAWYPYKFDRRHDISYVGAYSFSDNLSISATWMFGTSYPVTLMSGKYFGYGTIQYRDEEGVLFQEDFATLYAAKNNLRFESIHRLDLGINYKWINKKGKKRMLVGGIYNAYSRMNASFYYYSTKDPNDSNSEIVIRKTAVFPIVPTIKYVMLW